MRANSILPGVIVGFLAASACGTQQPLCESGIVLHLQVECCDAHNGVVTVEFPTSIRESYDVNLDSVLSGGSLDISLEMPSTAGAGVAHVSFVADGDGQERFSASGDIAVTPGSCSMLSLAAPSAIGVDAGAQ